MNKEIECPYCGTMNNEPEEYYEHDEDEQIEIECESCEKYFFTSYYRIVGWREGKPAPCLNGGEHSFEHKTASFGENIKYYLECKCGERTIQRKAQDGK